MLKNSLLQTSETVKIDILTVKDLEFWKQRLAGGSDASMTSVASSANSTMTPEQNAKRYLILTESSEFD